MLTKVNITGTNSIIDTEVKWNDTETYQTQCCQLLPVSVLVASTQKSNERILKHINTMMPIVIGTNTGSIDTEVKWNYWNISTQWCQLLPVPVSSTWKSNEMILKHINTMLPIVMGIGTGIIDKEVKWNDTETYQTQWCQLLPVLVLVASTQKSNERILKHINTMMPIVIGTNTSSIDMEVKWKNTETYQTQLCQLLLVSLLVSATRKLNQMILKCVNTMLCYQLLWVSVPVSLSRKSNKRILKHINTMMPIVTGICTGITDKEIKRKNTETYQHNDANCYWYLYRYHRQGSQMKWYWNISNTMLPIVTGIGTGSIDTEVKWNDAETYQHNDKNENKSDYAPLANCPQGPIS